jgi:alginate O-acetyltransferase complex protein AlgI
MWVLAAAILFGFKWLTWRRSGRQRAPLWRHVSYFLAWPGMDAEAFFDSRLKPAKPSVREWLVALVRLAVGITLYYGVARHMPRDEPYLVGWVGMIGMGMVLHFGAFHLLSCGLRSAGVEARPLMDRPLSSVRLADFWGRRWNTAFRDLTHRFLFRPLTRRLGVSGAVFVGFLASGLIHDVVISFPASGGYGGPTLFFLLQAVGLFAERSKMGRRLGLGAGVRGWLFTFAFLLLPAPLLFHGPFVARIIVPFMHVTGAI